jgi:ribosomal protein S10
LSNSSTYITPEYPTAAPDAEPESTETQQDTDLYPPNVLATYMAPMKHQAKHGIPVAQLQLRSYSVRNLEFFADFCMRAAFYLKMPASGPVPLPKHIQRWTTIRSTFIFKKSQENFERITYKRLITVMDGDKATVEAWLAFVRKWQFYGVGMKANVWEYEGLDVSKKMDATYEKEISEGLGQQLGMFGWNTKVEGDKASVQKLYLNSQKSGNVIGRAMADTRPLFNEPNAPVEEPRV